MALYPKKLNSVEQLHKERQKLLKKLEQANPANALPSTGDIPVELGGVLPFLQGIFSLVKEAKIKKRKKASASPSPAPKPANTAQAIFTDIAVSYLKWKIAFALYSGIKHAVQQRKKPAEGDN